MIESFQGCRSMLSIEEEGDLQFFFTCCPFWAWECNKARCRSEDLIL